MTRFWSIVAGLVDLFLDIHQSIHEVVGFEINGVGFVNVILSFIDSVDDWFFMIVKGIH